MQKVNDTQLTSESWEIGAGLINASQMLVVFKDENGLYHTVNAGYGQQIFGGTTEMIVLTGEIVEPQPTV